MKRHVGLRYYFLQNINPAVRLLIASDTVLVGAAGLLGPIFALFIEEYITTTNAAAVAGIAAAIFLVTKSLLQIPIAVIIDKIRGERDDFYFLVIFTFITGLIPLLYLVISESWQLYAVQFFLGVFTAFTYPSYMAIFTRHIDKKHEGTEWGVYFTLTDLSSAALAAIGGYMASTLGFPVLILAVVVLSTLGAAVLVPLKPYLKL